VLEGAAATPLLRKPHMALLPPLASLPLSTLAPSLSLWRCKAMRTEMSKPEGKRAKMLQMRCNAMQCDAMQCNAMQCNAMQCNAMQAMRCNDYNYNKGQSAAHPCPRQRCHTDSLVSLLPPTLSLSRSAAGEGTEGAGWKSRSRTTATTTTATRMARRAGLGPSHSLACSLFF
jgi:hypothetical protein